jgi:hypothetical protein
MEELLGAYIAGNEEHFKDPEGRLGRLTAGGRIILK